MRHGGAEVNRACTAWIGEMLRPLAGDEAGARFWSRHVRVGVALTETSAAVVVAYVVVADRPHRALLLGVAVLVMLSSPLLLAVPVSTLSTGVRGPLIFYLWSIAVTVVVAGVAFLDGGAESPLLWLLVLTMTFSALAYPPPGVLLMGALMVGAYLTVVIADDSLDPASLLVAAVLLSYTTMTSWVSRNHWDARDQQLLLAARMAELDQTREEFVATTSHELRTPVASILGYVELLEDDPEGSGPHLPAFLATIRRNGERLQRLSEDLLFLCHWDSQDRRPGDEDQPAGFTDLVEVAGRVHETMAPLAARERVSLSFDLPPQPLPVAGAADQLDRVFLNLVGNAVKYTPAGGAVSCRLTRVSGQAVIEVRDTGIGIAEDEVEALFGRFFRATSAREQSIAGVGLGLSIVHEVVRSLGGQVEVTSQLGVGSTFVVRLPCTVPTAARPNHAPPPVTAGQDPDGQRAPAPLAPA
jgi:signal transduction histidine kinase